MRKALTVSFLIFLAGCNASQMAGFAEAAREDRVIRSGGYDSYSARKREREMREMRRELEEMRRTQEEMCEASGGYMIGSSCTRRYSSRY